MMFEACSVGMINGEFQFLVSSKSWSEVHNSHRAIAFNACKSPYRVMACKLTSDR